MTQQSHGEKWSRITGEIGTWRQYRKGRGAALARTIEDAFTSLTAATQGARRGRGGRQRQRDTAAPLPPQTHYEPPPEEEGLPKWVVPAAVAGGALVLGLVIMSGMKGD